MTGRGGRGAALENLLKDELRRPGETSPEAPPPIRTGGRGAQIFAQTAVETPPIGRGRSVLLAQGDSPPPQPIGRGIAFRQTEPQSPVGEPAPVAVGRGSFIAASTSQPSQPLGRGSLLRAQAPAAPSVTATPVAGSVVSETVSSIDIPISDVATGISSTLEQTSISEKVASPDPVHFRGTEGQEVPVYVNYMKLEVEGNKGIHEYEIRFNPPLDAISVRYKCLKQLEEITGKTRTFDGVILYLPEKLPDSVMILPCKNPNDESPVTCTIKFKRTHRLSECIHFYNTLFKKIFHKLALVRFGRNFYSPSMKHGVPQHKLEVWPGYVTAVEEYEGGLYLNCDVSNRVLRTTTVYDVLQDCIQSHGSEWKKQFTNLILGNSVITRYNNTVYKVDDIDFDLSPRSTFPRNDGTEISYLQYYKQHYQIDIKDPDQPMLIHRPKKRDRQRESRNESEQLVSLVPELCCETGLSEAQRGNFTLMKDISAFTKPTPAQRQAAYEQYLRNVKSNPEAIGLLESWGLKLPDTSFQTVARTIAPETIYFGKNMSEPGTYNADWNRAVSNKPVLAAINLTNWVILVTQRDKRNCENFEEHMAKSTRQMGIQASKPRVITLSNDRTETYVGQLRDIIEPGLQIVVIIFPSLRSDRYAAVKKICCSEKPIASQVINGKTVSRPDKARSIVQKIALQMNCKMGGSLWTVQIPTPPNTKIMICGMDTYHEGAQKGNSVSAFVASMNDDFTRWYSRVAMQNKGQEIIDELKAMFAASLKAFHSVHGKFPDRIIIYRDGVGDGQLKLIRDYEIEQILSVFKVIAPDYEPKFTFIVVQKRINTRIFLSKGGRGNLDNPSPGTIIDHTVTRKYMKDFFLVPQLVRQGTVSPTHYIILYDSTNSQLKPGMAQKITYKLCHLYYNWPGTIRVPAPCQYAHKLAYLIGQSVKKPHAEVLSDKLFYL